MHLRKGTVMNNGVGGGYKYNIGCQVLPLTKRLGGGRF